MLTLRKPTLLMVTLNYQLCFSQPARLTLVELTKSFGVSKVLEEVLSKESTFTVFNEPPPV